MTTEKEKRKNINEIKRQIKGAKVAEKRNLDSLCFDVLAAYMKIDFNTARECFLEESIDVSLPILNYLLKDNGVEARFILEDCVKQIMDKALSYKQIDKLNSSSTVLEKMFDALKERKIASSTAKILKPGMELYIENILSQYKEGKEKMQCYQYSKAIRLFESVASKTYKLTRRHKKDTASAYKPYKKLYESMYLSDKPLYELYQNSLKEIEKIKDGKVCTDLIEKIKKEIKMCEFEKVVEEYLFVDLSSEEIHNLLDLNKQLLDVKKSNIPDSMKTVLYHDICCDFGYEDLVEQTKQKSENEMIIVRG